MSEENMEYQPYLRQFYENWGKRDLWTLEEAICLVHGMSPNRVKKGNSLVSKDPLFPFYQDDFNKTKTLAISSIKAAALIPDYKVASYSGRSIPSEFKPINFIKWAMGKGINPHPLLLEYTEYDKNLINVTIQQISSSQTVVATNSSQLLLKRYFEGRGHELDKAIEDIFRKLLFELEYMPSTTEVYNRLKALYKKDYSLLIIEIKTSSNEIVWNNSNVTKTMKCKTFENTVSTIRTDYVKQYISNTIHN